MGRTGICEGAGLRKHGRAAFDLRRVPVAISTSIPPHTQTARSNNQALPHQVGACTLSKRTDAAQATTSQLKWLVVGQAAPRLSVLRKHSVSLHPVVPSSRGLTAHIGNNLSHYSSPAQLALPSPFSSCTPTVHLLTKSFPICNRGDAQKLEGHGGRRRDNAGCRAG